MNHQILLKNGLRVLVILQDIVDLISLYILIILLILLVLAMPSRGIIRGKTSMLPSLS